MRAEILCVGTEILLGDIVNTNAAYLARELAAIGVTVYHQSVVGDNPARLASELSEVFARSDLAVLTGGLGPTYDDLTKQTICQAFHRELAFHPDILEGIRAFFETKLSRTMPPQNKQQAMLPVDCVIFDNPVGTAPGCEIGRAHV